VPTNRRERRLADQEEIEALRQLVYQFENSPVWDFVRKDIETQLEIDQGLLLEGSDRDDQIRGGIKAARDYLAIPDRLRQQLTELEEEEQRG
jgi:hypothetical protein